MAKVLILCPTFDHADTLFASIASVRAQTFDEWEMVVICDGSPPRTDEVLAAIAAVEPRVRSVRHPKSERYGENHRDPIIRESDAEFVCHLGDDDIWTGDHLAQMTALLEKAEWANQAPLRVGVASATEWWPVNHGTAAMRDAVSRRLPLSAGINYVAYRRDAYLKLPEGWTCAPWEAGTSDVYMWSKFFKGPLSVASSAVTTAIKFASSAEGRAQWTPENRLAEIMPWVVRLAEPGLADGLCRAGSIRARMIMLFALHGAGSSLNDAFERAGLVPAAADASPQPAVDGAPMVLPLTEAQRNESQQAWAVVRAYADQDEGSKQDARAAFDGSLALLLQAAQRLAWIAGVDAGLRALDDGRSAWPEAPAPLVLAASMLTRDGRAADADRYVDALARIRPNHPALARFRPTPEP